MQTKIAVAFVLAVVCGAGVIAAWQRSPDQGSISAPASVRDGVYTVDQAERGRATVDQQCVECHGEDLGGKEGSPLAGAAFLRNWASSDLRRLFKRVQDTMPSGRVNSVSDAEKVDAIAYILQVNGFPPGPAALPNNAEALGRISFPSGTGALQVGMVVRTIGCLAKTGDKEWVLNRATAIEPATLDPPAADDARTSVALSGTNTVPLLNVFPSPDAHAAHKMEARGMLLRNPAGPAINVVSITMLSATCP